MRRVVPMRHDAGVDLVAEMLQDFRGIRASAAAPGAIEARPDPEHLFQRFCQGSEFCVFNHLRQVAGVAVTDRDVLDKGRGDPGMQLGADFAEIALQQFQQRRPSVILGGDGVVDQIDRNNTEALEHAVRVMLMPHGCDLRRVAVERLAPVEVLLGVDRRDQERLGQGLGRGLGMIPRVDNRSRALTAPEWLLIDRHERAG